MLDFDIVLGFLEGEADFLASEDVPIEIFTEYLGSLVINFILRVNHDAILGTCLEKYSTNNLRMARVYEY